ncbi:MAG: tetratricopeptide repeat protein [Vicingaceae bacterium]|nr:tetratricopeptide repeat protein [Vicingaceae bacterium]
MKYLFPILFFISLNGFSQKFAEKEYYLIDSLILEELSPSDIQLLDSSLKLYHSFKYDTARVAAINEVCDKLNHSSWTKYQLFQYEKIKKGLKNNTDKKEARSYKSYLVGALYNMGVIYSQNGNIARSLELNYEALKLSEELNDKGVMALSLTSIGSIHYGQGEEGKAMDAFKRAMEISKTNKQYISVVFLLERLAHVSFDKKDYNKSLEYSNKAKSLSDSVGYKIGAARVIGNMGGVFKMLGDNEKALEYYNQSLKLARELNEPYLTSGNLANIGLLQYEIGNIKSAKENSLESMELAQKINHVDEIKNNAKVLSDIYSDEGLYNKSLKMYKLHIKMRDSLTNESIQKAVIQQQAKYEYEKQKAVDDAEHDKEIAIEQEAKEKQTILTYATAGGLGLVAIFLLVVFNRLKVTRKQKNIIEEQKTEVEKQKAVVELAHAELEEKNKEITDSIQYAKRIQNAILPPNKVVKEYLQESFIYYKPKDIVAGDFYWLEHAKHKVLFAAADCTGHGVPGAMVSVVCNNGLNRSVREFGLTDPGEILNKTREIVVEEFEKSEEEVKDGMDIALCSLQGNTLQYAGAHNPLWIIRDAELLETKANKQPIGQFDNPEPYITHTLELQKGDSLYIFSDGYVDQFGGDKGKKLKTANFKKLLLSIQKENMQKQKELLDEAFESWRGNLEQLDDVCVIGVKI